MAGYVYLVLMILHGGFEIVTSNEDLKGWTKVPGIRRGCTGDNVSLQWTYDQTLGTPSGVTVARSDLSTTLVSKFGQDEPQSHRPRFNFLENAGIHISNLKLEDAGTYECALFISAGKTLYNDATLETYKDCPNKEQFRTPEIIILFSEPTNLKEVNLDSPFGDRDIRVKVNVPKGKPRVNCTLFIDGDDFDCESGNATIPSKSQNDIIVAVKFEHLVLGESNRTLIFSSDSDEPVTTTYNIESGALTPEPYIAAIVTLSIVLAILMLLLLYCRPSCRKRIPHMSTCHKKADALREWWITDPSQQEHEQDPGQSLDEATYLTGPPQLRVPVQVSDASSQTFESRDIV